MQGSDANRLPATELEPLLSIADVAALLQISDSGVYRLIRRGELPSVKVGGSTRFERIAIREFIAAQRQFTSSPGSDSSRPRTTRQEAA